MLKHKRNNKKTLLDEPTTSWKQCRCKHQMKCSTTEKPQVYKHRRMNWRSTFLVALYDYLSVRWSTRWMNEFTEEAVTISTRWTNGSVGWTPRFIRQIIWSKTESCWRVNLQHQMNLRTVGWSVRWMTPTGFIGQERWKAMTSSTGWIDA
jgi:hypothetical protein